MKTPFHSMNRVHHELNACHENKASLHTSIPRKFRNISAGEI